MGKPGIATCRQPRPAHTALGFLFRFKPLCSEPSACTLDACPPRPRPPRLLILPRAVILLGAQNTDMGGYCQSGTGSFSSLAFAYTGLICPLCRSCSDLSPERSPWLDARSAHKALYQPALARRVFYFEFIVLSPCVLSWDSSLSVCGEHRPASSRRPFPRTPRMHGLCHYGPQRRASLDGLCLDRRRRRVRVYLGWD